MALAFIVPTVAFTEVTYVRIPWDSITFSDPPSKAYHGAPSAAQAAWIDRLVACESGGNPAAINPKDRDGTPSYGLLQFKPSTFAVFSKAYGIGTPADYMDQVAQRAIVARMMRDPSANWHQQFPVCVQRLGLPPGVIR